MPEDNSLSVSAVLIFLKAVSTLLSPEDVTVQEFMTTTSAFLYSLTAVYPELSNADFMHSVS